MQSPRDRLQPGQVCSRSLDNPRLFKNQDFDTLRDFHLKKGLFKDETFPADMRIIGPKLVAEFNMQNVEWKRPWEKCSKPRLIMDGASFYDIKQSKLGDCWVLSAMGSVTLKQDLLKIVMPLNQGFTTKYAGIFHFRFWHFGEWVDIVIDDLLPFVNGKYLSVQPSNGIEFWPCLVEKAYAKLCGSYENLHWGNPADAFVNLTGGITMSFNLKNTKMQHCDLWAIVNTAGPNTLMACISDKLNAYSRNRSSSVPFVNEVTDIRRNSAPSNINIHLGNGMVESHAYCVTDTKQISTRDGKENIIRLWNPWATGEWVGRWSDNCPRWKEVSHQDREKLYENKDNGEFWMSWEDFVQEFSSLIICSQTPDFLDWGDQSKKWYKTMYKNVWPKESNSTGLFYKDTFCKNPQYLIKVTAADEVKKGFNVWISLMQNPRNCHKFGSDWLPIGFMVSKVDAKVQDLKEKLPSSYFSKEMFTKVEMLKSREINQSFKLTAGTYVIIPYTTSRDEESMFLLQVCLKSKDCVYELGVVQSPKEFLKNEAISHETIFKQFATQGSKMNAYDLQRFLNEVALKGCQDTRGANFSIEASRGILSVMDYTGSGKLDLENFYRLEKYLNIFKDIFNEIDTNRSGFINLSGLQNAVTSTGIVASSDLLNRLICRYGDSANRLNIIDFLSCMIRLRATFKTFQKLSNDGKGVYVSQEKWMQLMMYI
ncbi:calpain-13-like [Discoglossus pictus]